MANPIPAAVSLSNIADGAEIIAVTHRNNYSAIQSAINALITAMSGGTSGQFMKAVDTTDVVWATVPSPIVFRKTTTKAATNTVTETDLLNGEFTLAASALATTGCLRLTCWGDGVWNSGGAQIQPRLKFKFGSTGTAVVIDTGTASPTAIGNSAARGSWRIVIEMMNLGSASSQLVKMSGRFAWGTAGGQNGQTAFTTGQGQFGTPSNSVSALALLEGCATATVDTSVAQLLALTVINGSATSTEMKLIGAIAEVL